MAYDKAIDSSVLDANLTSIADVIREKTELTDKFAFPQGFIDAISAIESGGGNISTEKLAWGIYRPSSKTTTITITHNLGVVPQLVVVCRLYTSLDSSDINNSILTYNYASNPKKYGIGSSTIGRWDIVHLDSDSKAIVDGHTPNSNHYEANTSIAILKTADITEFTTRYYFWFAATT